MKLSEIPTLTHIPQDGRVALLLPNYDAIKKEWDLFLPIEQDNFVRMPTPGMERGIYFGTSPARETDLELPLFTLICQHLTFKPIHEMASSLLADLNLLSASLEKLEMLREANLRPASSSLVESELEYMFILVRTAYDVLQDIAKEVAVRLTKDGAPFIAKLPRSFSKIVLEGDRLVSRDRIAAARKGLPGQLVDFYFKEAPHFDRLRKIRVSIEHSGRSLPLVFSTEHGFGIAVRGSEAWSSLPVWSSHELKPNGIGSVRALAAFIAGQFLRTLNDFEKALRSVIHPSMMPRSLSEGRRVFFTSPTVSRLSQLAEWEARPWVQS